MPGNPTRTYLYEDSRFPHHLTGLTDENGDRYASWAYDAQGRAILTTHAVTTNGIGQQHFDLRYDGADTIVTDAEGNVSIWTFDENLMVKRLRSRISLVDGKGISQEYDENNNLTSRTDQEGRRTNYSYNSTNQLTGMVEAPGLPEERSTRFDYVSPDDDLVTRIVESSVYMGQSRVTELTYDANLNPVELKISGFDPAGLPVERSETYTYDSNGHLVEIDGPRSDVEDITTLQYHECDNGYHCGQLARVRNGAGHEITFDDYDQAGRLLGWTDENGTSTRYTYDEKGRLLSSTGSSRTGESRETRFSYDLAGQLTAIHTPDGMQLAYSYDAAHELRRIGDDLGNRLEYTYDARGNRQVVELYDPDSMLVRQIEMAFDARNYPISVNAAGSTTRWETDATGNPIEQTDPNLNPSVRLDFDPLERLREIVDAAGGFTSIAHDVADNPVMVTAPNGAETRFTHDDLGNQLTEESPDRGRITRTLVRSNRKWTMCHLPPTTSL